MIRMAEEGVIAHLRKIFDCEKEGAPYSFLIDVQEIEEKVVAAVRAHQQQLKEKLEFDQKALDNLDDSIGSQSAYYILRGRITLLKELIEKLGGVEP